MKLIGNYECVIGLEIHIELKTASKIFCSCPTSFGAPPNTQCCPVCAGLPGALPRLNKRAVEYAVTAGLATNCRIDPISKFDRKNYFYPDLPKGYQITQYYMPLCENGWLSVETQNGEKVIGITRIHMEEDAGKLIHDGEQTLIDCNRCGVPLIEIVTEPDLRSSEEAVAFLKKLRTVLLYTGVSDCKMNEGSMRCDVNLSVRKTGETAFGVRTEMKNINSFAFTAKAIEYEYARQVALLESGGEVTRETRRFDSASGRTYPMRSKESDGDYRFFPEPDLPPLVLDREFTDKLKALIPELPDAKKRRYVQELGISLENAAVLTADRALAEFFEEAATHTPHTRVLANLTVTELLRLTDKSAESFFPPVSAKDLASLATLVSDGIINSKTAKILLSEMAQNGIDPVLAVEERGLAQIRERDVLLPLVKSVIAADERAVSDYANGKRGAEKAIIGRVMSLTGGRAEPVLLTSLVIDELKKLKK